MKITFLMTLLGVILAAVPSARATSRVPGGSPQANFAAFSPAAALPEPASIILFGSVLGLGAVIARRRSSRKR